MGRTSLASLQARLDRQLSPVIVTWNVVEYRKAAEKHVTSDDVVFLSHLVRRIQSLLHFHSWRRFIRGGVLEVGCCGGTTTSIIGRHCNYVMGIDQTKAEIEIARYEQSFSSLAHSLSLSLAVGPQLPGPKWSLRLLPPFPPT
eukprot:2710394-Rhodomonas_salina.1